ncbi:hypothetical protein [Spartinivicinus poritis]|uniref:Uncharacterized protein n=1 Tax=Spartinivicinus poritis TaxID=2994640 RepID=A0ABT5U8P6_9GAMM|nr:hypothetical protein [Spartinivicinus sp. A2-2]MDE1462744.1 hypothetical protein [Spartinivicinus sp. A2-2]
MNSSFSKPEKSASSLFRWLKTLYSPISIDSPDTEAFVIEGSSFRLMTDITLISSFMPLYTKLLCTAIHNWFPNGKAVKLHPFFSEPYKIKSKMSKVYKDVYTKLLSVIIQSLKL